MAGYLPVKMKRKDLDEVSEEFSDFSLSSPARKIRRLDVELPPIMEEPEFPAAFEQPLPEEQFVGMNNGPQLAAAVTEPTPSHSLNEEMALVLYKPVTGSSDISFKVHSDLLPVFKNQNFWSGSHSNLVKAEETASMNEKLATNNYLAVVPWVPTQVLATNPAMGDLGNSVSASAASEEQMEEPMEDEVEAMMEEDSMGDEGQATESRGMGVEGLQQWQQHCMTPQPPQPTTVMWSW